MRTRSACACREKENVCGVSRGGRQGLLADQAPFPVTQSLDFVRILSSYFFNERIFFEKSFIRFE